MPRKLLQRSSEFPYHVYNRTNDREFYPIEMNEVWKIYSDAARLISWAYGAKIHTLLVMTNHYHMVISTPDENLDDIMCAFQSTISIELSKRLGIKRFRFTGRYRWKIIKTVTYYKNVIRYICRNPVTANMCNFPETYPWSTCSGRFGETKLDIPLYHHEFLAADLWDWEHEIDWINCPFQGAELLDLEKNLWRKDIRQKRGEKVAGV